MNLDDSGLTKKTVNYHIIALRSFLRFLLKNDIDCLSPEKLELSKIPQREVSFLLESEVQSWLIYKKIRLFLAKNSFLLGENDPS